VSRPPELAPRQCRFGASVAPFRLLDLGLRSYSAPRPVY